MLGEGKRKQVWFNLIFDRYLLDHAEGHGNFSRYIKQLILKDIEKRIKKRLERHERI